MGGWVGSRSPDAAAVVGFRGAVLQGRNRARGRGNARRVRCGGGFARQSVGGGSKERRGGWACEKHAMRVQGGWLWR